jgi:hypothetical protein
MRNTWDVVAEAKLPELMSTLRQIYRMSLHVVVIQRLGNLIPNRVEVTTVRATRAMKEKKDSAGGTHPREGSVFILYAHSRPPRRTLERKKEREFVAKTPCQKP